MINPPYFDQFTRSSPTYDELVTEVAAIKQALGPLSHLNTQQLTDVLEQNWTPDADTVLLPHSTGPSALEAIPQARVTNSANEVIGTGAFTVLTFDTEAVANGCYDIGGMHDNTTNNSRLLAVIDGLYDIGTTAQFASNAAGERSLQLKVNGATVIDRDIRLANTLPDQAGISISTEYRLNAGDYVEAEVLQTSGGNLNVLTFANYSPILWASWKSN